MAELYLCEQCGDTFFLDEGTDKCSKCGRQLVPFCEWCNLPEKQCKCGKEKLKVE